MTTEKTDVVIVGVGAAGGILAAELGKAGMKVIGLERGPRLTTQDFDPHDELRYFQRQDLRPNIKRQPITWRPNATASATATPVQNYGKQAGGGNVFEAPRRRDYPLPPLRLDQGAILFEAATRKLGHHPFSTPRAILSEPYNDRPACTYCGFCQAFGCHVGAKSSILITKLPE